MPLAVLSLRSDAGSVDRQPRLGAQVGDEVLGRSVPGADCHVVRGVTMGVTSPIRPSPDAGGGDGDGAATPGRARILAWLLLGALLLVLVVGIVAAIVREPARLDPDTPEGVVQSYLQAVFDADWPAAREHLATGPASRCTTAEFRRAWVPPSLTATLDGTRVLDGTAEVDVELRQAQGPDPLGGGEFAQAETFELVEVDGDWFITGRPWPVDDCRG